MAALSSAGGHGGAAGGTIGYMPLEQLEGLDVSEAADEWALAVLTFDLTATNIPMMPLRALAAAPTKNATAVRTPRSTPTTPVSEYVSNAPTSAPITTAVMIANTAIVLYWRVMNASAPS